MYNYSFDRTVGDSSTTKNDTIIKNNASIVNDPIANGNCPFCGRFVGDGNKCDISGSDSLSRRDSDSLSDKTASFDSPHHPLCPLSSLFDRRFCYECGTEITSGDSFVILARHCFCLECVNDNTFIDLDND